VRPRGDEQPQRDKQHCDARPHGHEEPLLVKVEAQRRLAPPVPRPLGDAHARLVPSLRAEGPGPPNLDSLVARRRLGGLQVRVRSGEDVELLAVDAQQTVLLVQLDCSGGRARQWRLFLFLG
jgi:hypothetical protein